MHPETTPGTDTLRQNAGHGPRRAIALLLAAVAIIAALCLQWIQSVRVFAGEVYRNTGLILDHAGDPAGADRAFAGAIRWYPHDYRTYYDRLVAGYGKDDPQARTPVIEACLALAPNHSGALLEAAYAAAQLGGYLQAKGYLDRLDAIYPRFWRAYYMRGICEGIAGNDEAAADAFERALLTRHAARDEIVFQLAVAQHATGRLEAALASITEAVKADPGEPAVYLEQGRILHALARYEDSRRALKRYWGIVKEPAALSPTEYEFYLEALVLDTENNVALGDISAAIDTFERYIAAAPATEELPALALKIADAAERSYSEPAGRSTWLRRLAEILIQTGQERRAANVYARAQNLAPVEEQPGLAIARAALLMQIGRADEAEAVLRGVPEGDARTYEFHVLFARVLAANGKRDEARRIYRYVIDTVPLGPPYIDQLISELRALGEP